MDYKIIFEAKSRPKLRYHEINAILALSTYFKCDITCLCPSDTKTPDLRINNIDWELKSPQGSGLRTIENILKKATKQSENIVLDLTRIKMNEEQALARTKYYFRHNKNTITRLLIIAKNGKIVDLTDRM